MASNPKLPVVVRSRHDGCTAEPQFLRESHKVEEVEGPPFFSVAVNFRGARIA